MNPPLSPSGLLGLTDHQPHGPLKAGDKVALILPTVEPFAPFANHTGTVEKVLKSYIRQRGKTQLVAVDAAFVTYVIGNTHRKIHARLTSLHPVTK